MNEAYIFDAVRTPRARARPTGGLHAVRPVVLLGHLIEALRERGSVEEVDDVLVGCVTQTGDQGANIGKIAALYAGWQAPGATINRFCASGLEACNLAAMKVMTGSDQLVAAGGVESMSRVPMFSDNGAWFADPDVARKTRFVHMGIAADLLATRSALSRQQLDAYAVQSHRRAARARDDGKFEGSLVPVEGLRRDELIRDGASAESFASLAPAFSSIPHPFARLDHLHTVATSPGMCDGASLILWGAACTGRVPRARFVASATASVDPEIMLTGNVGASQRALARAGLTANDIDVFEVNESFAAVPLHYAREMDIDPERLNPNGGALAMGHPLGATGAVLLSMVLDELEHRDARYGLASICGGAGIASTTIIERV